MKNLSWTDSHWKPREQICLMNKILPWTISHYKKLAVKCKHRSLKRLINSREQNPIEDPHGKIPLMNKIRAEICLHHDRILLKIHSWPKILSFGNHLMNKILGWIKSSHEQKTSHEQNPVMNKIFTWIFFTRTKFSREQNPLVNKFLLKTLVNKFVPWISFHEQYLKMNKIVTSRSRGSCKCV
jgi:hypothetical protein